LCFPIEGTKIGFAAHNSPVLAPEEILFLFSWCRIAAGLRHERVRLGAGSRLVRLPGSGSWPDRPTIAARPLVNRASSQIVRFGILSARECPQPSGQFAQKLKARPLRAVTTRLKLKKKNKGFHREAPPSWSLPRARRPGWCTRRSAPTCWGTTCSALRRGSPPTKTGSSPGRCASRVRRRQ
jgi:hypothetical protein